MRIGDPPSELTETELRVREALNAWDPLGVQHIGLEWPEDEYDDLIQPIITAVSSNPSAAALAAGLHTALTVDYALSDPQGCDTAAVALLEVLVPSQSSVAP